MENFISLFVLLLISSDSITAHNDPIVELYEQFKPAMALSNSLTLNDWTKSLPTDKEKDEMFRLIDFIYPMDSYRQLNNSFLATKFPTLAKAITITIIEDRLCVIHEPFNASDPSFKFPRFFGFTVLRAESNITRRRLHHSAAHFQTDGRVCFQASSMFSATEGKSLVIAGASRWAVNGSHPSPCQPKEQVADAAHNNNLLFHIANVAIWEAARKYSKEEEFEDHFIQWHGMAETSCPQSRAFISIGASGTHKAYNDDKLYANMLKSTINQITGSIFAQTPQSDTNCSLRATTNVFGRIINGVHFGDECAAFPTPEDIHGNFLHIEQKMESRDNLTLWQEAFDKLTNASNSTNQLICPLIMALVSLSIIVRFK